jgi:hypothetical protein
MNKSKKYNKLGNKVKNNQTKRRHKIRGGGYDATLVVIPVYDLGDDGEPIITKITKLKERFFPTYNLNLRQRTDYMDDLIRLTIDDETLVPKGIIPVVHRLKGRRPQNKKAVEDVAVANVPVASAPEATAPNAAEEAKTESPATSAYKKEDIAKKLSELYPDSNTDSVKNIKNYFGQLTFGNRSKISTVKGFVLAELRQPANKEILEKFMKSS